MTKPELLTSLEVAELTNRSRRDINRLAASNKLPVAHRSKGLTGQRLFKRRDVEKFLAAQTGGE